MACSIGCTNNMLGHILFWAGVIGLAIIFPPIIFLYLIVAGIWWFNEYQ